LREEHRPRIFESRVLRKIFGARRDEVTWDWSLTICTPHQIHCSTHKIFMETRLVKLYYFEAAEFENDIEIFSLALIFELQIWHKI